MKTYFGPMDKATRDWLDQLHTQDANARYEAFLELTRMTNERVDWFSEAADELFLMCRAGDYHQRAMSVQLLANLAKSDPERQVLARVDELLRVTADERITTARHALQSFWKIAIVDVASRERVNEVLSERFERSFAEENGTLLRYDIHGVLRKVFDHTSDAKLVELATSWLERETDEKSRRKSRTVWKGLITNKS